MRDNEEPFRVSAIRAQLFYETTGRFSVPLAPSFAAWNVVIGGGDADAPSRSTLITVEITAQAGAYRPERKVEFTAQTEFKGRRRILLRRTVATGIFSQTGKWYAAFFLYDTGCEPLLLEARMTGQKEPSVRKQRIPFRCGE